MQVLPVPIHTLIKNDLPAVEIRKATTDVDTIKLLVTAAVQERPVLILPVASNKLALMSSLVEKGLVRYDRETQQYFWLF